MKILHVTDWANGGLATYFEAILDAQTQKYNVSILASLDNSENRITKREEFISLGSYKRSLFSILKAVITTRQFIKKIEPDILHVHSSFAGLFARVATIGLRNRPKVIYCAHGWSFLMQGNSFKRWIYIWIEKALAYLSDAIITISHNEHQGAIDIGIDEDKLYEIHHGISEKYDNLDPDFLYSNKFQKDKFNILFLGRYDEAKGFDWLMDFIRNHPLKEIVWHCAGKAIVNQNVPIPAKVYDYGWVEYKFIPQLLLRCDAIIMPSRWEGFGLSAIEAMKYSKPVIASKNGALPELIKHNENGYLFDMNNDIELLDILQNLEKNRLQTMGEIGCQLFTQKYNETEMITKLERLIHDTV